MPRCLDSFGAKRFAFALLAASLAACAGTPIPLKVAPSWAGTDGVRFVCANQKTFIISFSPTGDRAVIKLGDDLYEARQGAADSGVRYASDDIDFTGKGRTGQLTKSPDGIYPKCKAVD